MVQADPGDDWRNETRQHGSLCEGEGRGTTRKVTHGVSLQTALNLDPFMIHETFPYLTETAFGSHPCRVVSATYRTLRPFHGDVTDEKDQVRIGSDLGPISWPMSSLGFP